MNHVERFHSVMQFKPVDRLPLVEWALWWDVTIKRWHNEGLPKELNTDFEIRRYLGLDPYHMLWIVPFKPTCPKPKSHGACIIEDCDGYERIKEHLFPMPGFDKELLRAWANKHKQGELVIWMEFWGFFAVPRQLLGIEPHLYAFYDNPELMHKINKDLVSYMLHTLDEICSICIPDFVVIGEDMSYNNGPMISKECFDNFLAPYYKEVIPVLKEKGIIPIVDSDGDVTELIPWLEEVGIEGILPLERMAGTDVSRIRQNRPHFKMIGCYDKMVMKRGEEAMRKEFERLLPVMQQGGFIPSVDHQTPPDVSLKNYKCYVSLLREYCEKDSSGKGL